MSRWPQLSFSILVFIANQVFFFICHQKNKKNDVEVGFKSIRHPVIVRYFSQYTPIYFLHKRIGNLNFLLPYFEGCRPCPFFCYFGCICCSIFVFCYYCWWPSLHSKSLYKSRMVSHFYLGWFWTGL